MDLKEYFISLSRNLAVSSGYQSPSVKALVSGKKKTPVGVMALYNFDDFSLNPYVASIHQDTRVKIDEQGVTAASYIEIIGAGAAEPPDEIIDFVLDRPFVFAITKRDIPLFVGTVNTP